jgi:hypothetical protein
VTINYRRCFSEPAILESIQRAADSLAAQAIPLTANNLKRAGAKGDYKLLWSRAATLGITLPPKVPDNRPRPPDLDGLRRLHHRSRPYRKPGPELSPLSRTRQWVREYLRAWRNITARAK